MDDNYIEVRNKFVFDALTVELTLSVILYCVCELFKNLDKDMSVTFQYTRNPHYNIIFFWFKYYTNNDNVHLGEQNQTPAVYEISLIPPKF